MNYKPPPSNHLLAALPCVRDQVMLCVRGCWLIDCDYQMLDSVSLTAWCSIIPPPKSSIRYTVWRYHADVPISRMSKATLCNNHEPNMLKQRHCWQINCAFMQASLQHCARSPCFRGSRGCPLANQIRPMVMVETLGTPNALIKLADASIYG